MKKMCVKGDAHLFCYDSIFCFRIDITDYQDKKCN